MLNAIKAGAAVLAVAGFGLLAAAPAEAATVYHAPGVTVRVGQPMHHHMHKVRVLKCHYVWRHHHRVQICTPSWVWKRW